MPPGAFGGLDGGTRTPAKVPICKGSCRLLATPNNLQATSLACAALLASCLSSGRDQAPGPALRGALAGRDSARWPLAAASAPAETPQEKYDATQGQARRRAGRPELAGGDDRRAERGDRLDDRRSLGAAPGTGRGRGRTGRKAGRARRGDRRAGDGKRAPRARCASSCDRALDVLGDRLVAIYEAGSPNILNAILESENWSEMSAQTEYLSQIQSYDDVGRRPGQGAARRSHRRRRAARRQPRQDRGGARRDRRQGARSRRARAEAEARFAELKAAQAERRAGAGRARIARRGAQRQPRRDLRTDRLRRRPDPAGDRPGAAEPRAESAGFITESEASAPASRPAGGQGGDRRRQRDRHHALHLGRRPRLLRILRLRLLGRGQLRAARRRLARKPARLDRPLDLGRTGRRASGSPSTPTPATPG